MKFLRLQVAYLLLSVFSFSLKVVEICECIKDYKSRKVLLIIKNDKNVFCNSKAEILHRSWFNEGTREKRQSHDGIALRPVPVEKCYKKTNGQK